MHKLLIQTEMRADRLELLDHEEHVKNISEVR